MMFSGLRSRWMICSSCACWSPWHIWISSGTPSAGVNGTPPRLVLAQRLAFQERHHQVDQPLPRLAQPEDRADVGMVEPHGDGRLAAKPLHRRRIAREPRQQDLERDDAPGLDLLRPVHVRHPAFAEPGAIRYRPSSTLAGERREDVGRRGRGARASPDPDPPFSAGWSAGRWAALGCPDSSTRGEPSLTQYRAGAG